MGELNRKEFLELNKADEFPIPFALKDACEDAETPNIIETAAILSFFLSLLRFPMESSKQLKREKEIVKIGIF